ncbi:MAG: trehalase family glycosidase, partial [Aggregatilineales bacterium]
MDCFDARKSDFPITFANYAIKTNDFDEEGHILYGDLSAHIFPLFVEIADLKQAQHALDTIKEYFKGDMGLATTSPELRKISPLIHHHAFPDSFDNFQWEDNSWGPLMIVAVQGFLNYADRDKRFLDFALDIATMWVQTLEDAFNEKHSDSQDYPHRLVEKYAHDRKQPLNEGFYNNLFGFGWTIASYIYMTALLQKHNRLAVMKPLQSDDNTAS